MSGFAIRVSAAVGAGALTALLSVIGGAPAGAAPASGQVDSMQDLQGAWLTSLSGFQEGQPVKWQHRLTVRKVRGSAAVAWEEWRDCAGHGPECKAGKVTGDGWSTPSRVLLAMDAMGIVHGVGATGTITLTPDEGGLSALVLSAGQQEDWTVIPAPATTGQSSVASRQASAQWNGGYAGYGSTVRCPDHG